MVVHLHSKDNFTLIFIFVVIFVILREDGEIEDNSFKELTGLDKAIVGHLHLNGIFVNIDEVKFFCGDHNGLFRKFTVLIFKND
jgi:hypothetical protein